MKVTKICNCKYYLVMAAWPLSSPIDKNLQPYVPNADTNDHSLMQPFPGWIQKVFNKYKLAKYWIDLKS
jgi:hypothetical protein